LTTLTKVPSVSHTKKSFEHACPEQFIELGGCPWKKPTGVAKTLTGGGGARGLRKPADRGRVSGCSKSNVLKSDNARTTLLAGL